ncbi:hypothetical protein DESC_610280 [Desulfosarcina cetonica]|nr:hypothetical protein DESC_610280 [Desulfosarcina cetonica]
MSRSGFPYFYVPLINRTLPTVNANVVAGADHHLVESGGFLFLVAHQAAASDHAGLAQAVGDHRRVGGEPTAGGEQAVGGMNLLDVVGYRVTADQNQGRPRFGFAPAVDLAYGEDRPPAHGTAGHPDTMPQVAFGIDVGIEGQDGFTFANGHVAGLQEVDIVAGRTLEGELHLLGAPAFLVDQRGGPFADCRVDGRKVRFQGDVGVAHLDFLLLDRYGQGTHQPGNHVLALVFQGEITPRTQGVAGPARVVGKKDPRAGLVRDVAKNHFLDGDGGAPIIGDAHDFAVGLGAMGLPGGENRVDGHEELIQGILGDLRAFVLNALLVGQGDHLHLLPGESLFQGDAQLGLEFGDDGVEIVPLQANGHAVALQEATVVVPGEPGVVHALGQSGGDLLVDAHVQEGLHHAGLGNGGPATHREEQGVGRVAETFAGDFLHVGHMAADLLTEVFGHRREAVDQLPAAEGLGGDDESRRHRQAQVFQFEQVESLVAHVDDAHGLVVDFVQGGDDPLGVEIEQPVKLVLG